MPSLAQLRAKTAANPNSVSNGGTVAPVTPIITPENLVQIPAAAPLDLPVMQPQRGVFPTSMVLDSDRSDSTRVFRGPNTRSAVFQNPRQVIPTTPVSAAVASTNSPVAAVLQILVNNQSTPNQNILNFVPVGGLTISAGPDGQIIFTTPESAGDGLVHGDAIWDIDSGVIRLQDDFVLTNAPNTGAIQSEYAWSLAVNASTFKYIPGSFPTGNNSGAGYIAFSNSAIANNIALMAPGNITSGTTYNTNAWPLFDYPSWKLVWVFKIARLQGSSASSVSFSSAQTSFYIGLGNAPGYSFGTNQSPRPPYFFGLRYDTDTTSPSIADTTFHFEAVANSTSGTSRINTQGNTFDTGVVPTENVSYRLELLYTTSGSLQFTLISSAGDDVTQTLAIPKYSTTSGVEIQAANGLAQFFLRGITGPAAAGSVVNFSGLTGVQAVFNGNQTITDQVTSSGEWVFPYASAVADGVIVAAVGTGYPAVIPYMAFGNDSSATPVAGSKGVWIDFFGFVWNPGVNTANALSPNSAKVRYW